MTSAPNISFGTDGWRAVIADDFTFDNVRACARAVAAHLKSEDRADKGVVIGYDTRFASEQFAHAAATALAGAGIRDIAISDGPIPTPALSLAVVQRSRAIGLMITASHNPAEWNGFKVKSAQGGSASPEEVAKIEALLPEAHREISVKPQPDYKVETHDLLTPYVNAISALVDINAIRDAGFNIAVDSMHGSGAGVISRALAGGDTTVTELRSEVNPSFPGMKQPEPIDSNLSQLTECVRTQRFDVGLATDGDADRLGVVDEHGRYLTSLEVFSMLFHHLKSRRGANGGAASTITMSSMVDILAAHHKTDSYRTPVGFKFVGPAMIDNACVIGGEESGGYAFAGHIPERDGALSALIFLESMAHSGLSPSQLLAEIHEITGPRSFKRNDETFDPRDRDRIARILTGAIDAHTLGAEVSSVSQVDGLRVEYDDSSWGVARLSGTEPLVRLYAEARTQQRRDEILDDLAKFIGI